MSCGQVASVVSAQWLPPAYLLDSYLATVTGQCARAITSLETEPNIIRVAAPLPPVPTTMWSMSLSSAYTTMDRAASRLCIGLRYSGLLSDSRSAIQHVLQICVFPCEDHYSSPGWSTHRHIHSKKCEFRLRGLRQFCRHADCTRRVLGIVHCAEYFLCHFLVPFLGPAL